MSPLRQHVGTAAVLLVVPPFGGIDRPSLGAHLLQACAARAGIAVDVYYANLTFAARIGERPYEAIAYAPGSALAGERIFARAAYGIPPLGRNRQAIGGLLNEVCATGGIAFGELEAIERTACDWVLETARQIRDAGYRVVGCSTTFEQTAASVALLNAVRAIAPSTITLLGGANCDGPMADGVLSLPVAADFVFRGESEDAFTRFLQGWRSGRLPPGRIISGEPCAHLDALPIPDYTQFFRQTASLSNAFSGQYDYWLVYETSRGCWWGAKQHCTFCGLNAEQMTPRTKSADRVVADLALLRERHGERPVCLTDNIMPHEYFRTLLPRLQRDVPGIELFYESKSNLSLTQARALVDAGVRCIQPGIEALSTPLLQAMRKGVTARQNLALLRHARACGLELRWNLLHGIPGDAARDYEEQLALLPLLVHLEPPQGLFGVTIDRFSPYHSTPERFGIRNVRPIAAYGDVLPHGARTTDIAYHFDGEFDSGSRCDPGLIHRIRDQIASWKDQWRGDSRPVLAVAALDEGDHILIDTRDIIGCATSRRLTTDQAEAVLASRPLRTAGAMHAWARRQKLAVAIDGWHVGLATAAPGTLDAFARPATRETTTRSVRQ